MEDRGLSVLTFRDVELLNSSISDNKILLCKFYNNNLHCKIQSNLLNCKGRFLLPSGFEKGVTLTPENFREFNYIDPLDVLNNDGRIVKFRFEPKDKENVKVASLQGKMTRKEAKANIANVRKAETQGMKFGL